MFPGAHVLLRHDHGARLREQLVTRYVVQVVVGVDDVTHRQGCHLPDGHEQGLGRRRRLEGIDDRHRVTAHHEAGVATGVTAWHDHGGPYPGLEFVEREERPDIIGRDRRGHG